MRRSWIGCCVVEAVLYSAEYLVLVYRFPVYVGVVGYVKTEVYNSLYDYTFKVLSTYVYSAMKS